MRQPKLFTRYLLIQIVNYVELSSNPFFCVKMDNGLYIVKSSAIDYNNQYFSIFR